jgi:hypothetical protein
MEQNEGVWIFDGNESAYKNPPKSVLSVWQYHWPDEDGCQKVYHTYYENGEKLIDNVHILDYCPSK